MPRYPTGTLMVHPTQQRRSQTRGKRSVTLTITRGAGVRTIRLPAWTVGAAIFLAAGLLPAYIAATGYLLYRDDLLGASMARQVAIQYAYEDRIAALRSEIDRVTSRHLVETQGVEDQVAILLERQAVIDRRQKVLGEIFVKARESGVALAYAAAPLPRSRPAVAQDDPHPPRLSSALAYSGSSPGHDIITGSVLRPSDQAVGADPESIRPMLKDIQSSLEATQADQSRALDALLQAAHSEAQRLASALAPIVGLESGAAQAAGGPFVPAPPMHFVEKFTLLESMLSEIAANLRHAAGLPLSPPIAAPVSSGFGTRLDPFLGKPALHSGIDFVAEAGSPVRATAPGTVASAGWNGGYGQMVEIHHAGGVSTRYAHLSETHVAAGDKVRAGAVIGAVGSTGRSTGPHLHYETRQRGKPTNPILYLEAGRAL